MPIKNGPRRGEKLYQLPLRRYRKYKKPSAMLFIIAVVLVGLWLLGFATHFLGNFIHILLVLAIIFFLIRVIQGRNPLK